MDTQKKSKLYRSRKDKIIAGICGGLAEYFDTDPVIVRIIFVLLALFNGFGLLIYLIMFIIMPKEPAGLSQSEAESEIDHAEKIKDFAHQAGQRIRETAHDFHKEMKWTAEEIKAKREARSKRRAVIGTVAVVFGILLLFEAILPIHIFSASIFWPSALIFVGLLLIINNLMKRN